MASNGRDGDDADRVDPLLLADSVPARAAPRSRTNTGRVDVVSGPVDPRTEGSQSRPVTRARPRGIVRPEASSVATEALSTPLPTAVDLEVAARSAERIPESSEMIWAAASSPVLDERPGPIDVITVTPPPAGPPIARRDDRIGEPLTGVPVPVVVPGTPADTFAGPAVVPAVVPVVPVVPAASVTKVRRKERPKVVRLPRRARVRKVSRVVRSIDAWSVFKVSVVFYLAMYVVFLVAGVLLWNVAYSTGTIDNISSFFESFGWKSFEFKGSEIYHNAWIMGLFVVAGLTGLNVVLATLYNLITDLVGGIRLTVLEEEVLVRAAPTNQGAGQGRPSTTTIKATRRDKRRAKRQPAG